MATSLQNQQAVFQEALAHYLISMARTVEVSVNRALSALLGRSDDGTEQSPGQIFLLEPRINEMEMVIDDHAVRMLRDGRLAPEEIRQVVATLKITNDLERMGDLAVNIAERVISLAEMSDRLKIACVFDEKTCTVSTDGNTPVTPITYGTLPQS